MLSPPFVGVCQPQYLQRPRVHLQFQELAAAQPDRPCVVTDTSEHSYGEVRIHPSGRESMHYFWLLPHPTPRIHTHTMLLLLQCFWLQPRNPMLLSDSRTRCLSLHPIHSSQVASHHDECIMGLSVPLTLLDTDLWQYTHTQKLHAAVSYAAAAHDGQHTLSRHDERGGIITSQ
jgi:hypothetical protein